MMSDWLYRLRCRWWLWRNTDDALSRRVSVERYLIDAARGKKPLPDQAKCRQLANKLGNPEWVGSRKARVTVEEI